MSGRPSCAWCARPAHRVTEARSDHFFADETRADAERRIAGNRRILRSSFTAAGPGVSSGGRELLGYLALTLDAIDGPRFVLNYAPFCRLKCAEEFARAAYVAGFRKAAP